MNVTLTGAAGKLGRHVCRQLVAAGHRVRATDCTWHRDLPSKLEIANLLQPEAAYGLLDGADALVHLANHPDFRRSDAQRIFCENVNMNMNVFQAAAEVGVRKIVFSSSVQVLSGSSDDRPPYLPFDSSMPARPANPYALSKHVSEQLLAYYAARHQLDAIALRFPWIVNDELLDMLRQQPNRAPNPHEGFTYLHHDDAATLIAAVLAAPLPGYRNYFATARSNRLRRPAAELATEFYPSVPVRHELTSLVDISLITRETGWLPQHELQTA